MLLEISRNSQENTCARVSFLIIMLQPFGLQLYQKSVPGKRNTFSTEHLWETASDIKFIYIENVRLVLFVVFYRDHRKFDLTGGFFIFQFMVTGRGIIFICSAVEGQGYQAMRGGEGFGE